MEGNIVSVIIPGYNEEATIKTVLEKVTWKPFSCEKIAKCGSDIHNGLSVALGFITTSLIYRTAPSLS